jgi:hypothetical protein
LFERKTVGWRRDRSGHALPEVNANVKWSDEFSPRPPASVKSGLYIHHTALIEVANDYLWLGQKTVSVALFCVPYRSRYRRVLKNSHLQTEQVTAP